MCASDLCLYWTYVTVIVYHTQGMVQENCDNYLSLLQQIPGNEKVNYDDVQELMIEGRQQELTEFG